MSFFSSKSATMGYRLIVDMEPNSIGLGLVPGNSSALEFIDRQYVDYGKRPSMKQMQGKLSTLLRNMMKSSILPKLGRGTITSIFCIHSSAWSVAETHTVDLRFQNNIKIQEKLIIDSIHQHRAPGVSSNAEHNLDLVYHHVQKVRLNGYFTDAPWGKTAQNVSCDLIEGYIDSAMKKFCEDELLRYATKLTHVPEGFVVLNAARQIVPSTQEFLIVHIGGETTEIIYADKDYLRQTASAPSGISSLVRATSEFVHDDVSLAFSHVTMSAKGYRIPTKKEQTAIDNAIETWRNDFMKGVQAACGGNVPENIYFFSALHSMSIAQHMLNAEKLGAWTGKKHQCTRLFGKKTFQHDFMIAAGALYVVE